MQKIKLTLIFFFLTILIANVNGQETKKATATQKFKNYKTKEFFNVLVSNPEIKHGAYRNIIAENIAMGQYDHGKKVGVWQYISDGILVQKYDFTNQVFLLNTTRNMIRKVWTIDSAGNNIRETLAEPVFLGGNGTVSAIFAYNIKYPDAAVRRNIEGTAVISAIITKDGQMIDEKIESNLGFGLDEEALKAFKILPDTWIPANLNAQPVATRVELLLYFSLIPNGNYWTQLFHL